MMGVKKKAHMKYHSDSIHTLRSSGEYSLQHENILCPLPPHLRQILELGSWFLTGQSIAEGPLTL